VIEVDEEGVRPGNDRLGEFRACHEDETVESGLVLDADRWTEDGRSPRENEVVEARVVNGVSHSLEQHATHSLELVMEHVRIGAHNLEW
jgi:hypothetical protein